MKSQYQVEIIDRIRRLRHDNQYSQAELATLLGISRGQIGCIESHRYPHKYSLHQIYTICQEFKFRIEHLFLTDADYQNGNNIIDTLIIKIIKYEE